MKKGVRGYLLMLAVFFYSITYAGSATLSPLILVSGALNSMHTVYGSTSVSQSFSVSGTNMVAGILASAPSGFELSLSAGSGYASTITIGSSGTILSAQVYVRISSSAPVGNLFSGIISLSSSGALTVMQPAGSGTVTAAPLIITAVNKSKVYGAAIPALTASYAGFVNGDTRSVLNDLPVLGTTATAGVNVGSFPITVTGNAISGNYSITYIKGILLITKAPLIITPINQTMI